MKRLVLILACAACTPSSQSAGDSGPRRGDSGQPSADAALADVPPSSDVRVVTDANSGGRDAGALTPDGSIPAQDGGAVVVQDAGLPGDCDALLAAIGVEARSVRSCSSNEQCGQVMRGTSCGCTRDWVARLDADLSWFDLLRTRGNQLECGLPFVSTCDCPRTDGFICTGMCQWNYTQ